MLFLDIEGLELEMFKVMIYEHLLLKINIYLIIAYIYFNLETLFFTRCVIMLV